MGETKPTASRKAPIAVTAEQRDLTRSQSYAERNFSLTVS